MPFVIKNASSAIYACASKSCAFFIIPFGADTLSIVGDEFISIFMRLSPRYLFNIATPLFFTCPGTSKQAISFSEYSFNDSNNGAHS